MFRSRSASKFEKERLKQRRRAIGSEKERKRREKERKKREHERKMREKDRKREEKERGKERNLENGRDRRGSSRLEWEATVRCGKLSKTSKQIS